MSVLEIYNKIHQCIVDYWTMFIGSPVDDFTTILWNLVVYGTQFFIGFVFEVLSKSVEEEDAKIFGSCCFSQNLINNFAKSFSTVPPILQKSILTS